MCDNSQSRNHRKGDGPAPAGGGLAVICFAALCFFGLNSHSFGDTIVLKDGHTLTGDILLEKESQVVRRYRNNGPEHPQRQDTAVRV